MMTGESIFHSPIRKCILGAFAIIALGFCLLFIYPNTQVTFRFLPSVDRSDVSDFRDYYSTIAALFAIAINMFAVILGGFYYLDKNVIDERRKFEDRRDRISSQIIHSFKEYEASIRSYMELRNAEEEPIRTGQQLIRQKQEIFEDILNECSEKLGTALDLNVFLSANEFFEKSPAMDVVKFKQLTEADVYVLMDSFTDKLKAVRCAIRNI